MADSNLGWSPDNWMDRLALAQLQERYPGLSTADAWRMHQRETGQQLAYLTPLMAMRGAAARFRNLPPNVEPVPARGAPTNAPSTSVARVEPTRPAPGQPRLSGPRPLEGDVSGVDWGELTARNAGVPPSANMRMGPTIDGTLTSGVLPGPAQSAPYAGARISGPNMAQSAGATQQARIGDSWNGNFGPMPNGRTFDMVQAEPNDPWLRNLAMNILKAVPTQLPHSGSSGGVAPQGADNYDPPQAYAPMPSAPTAPPPNSSGAYAYGYPPSAAGGASVPAGTSAGGGAFVPTAPPTGGGNAYAYGYPPAAAGGGGGAPAPVPQSTAAGNAYAYGYPPADISAGQGLLAGGPIIPMASDNFDVPADTKKPSRASGRSASRAVTADELNARELRRLQANGSVGDWWPMNQSNRDW